MPLTRSSGCFSPLPEPKPQLPKPNSATFTGINQNLTSATYLLPLCIRLPHFLKQNSPSLLYFAHINPGNPRKISSHSSLTLEASEKT